MRARPQHGDQLANVLHDAPAAARALTEEARAIIRAFLPAFLFALLLSLLVALLLSFSLAFFAAVSSSQ